ncbi:hypothetical protein CYG49_04050 [Candidatus Saccharibacteria bacterium]|nr:MAG: hypothetical protein CYG49_04050 [Candidatus Saccharibacteria bacterium]
MKVLFVCAYNVGRSQMAEGLFNKYITGSQADSAGTIVADDEGETIEERAQTGGGAKHVIAVMDEEGIDVRQSKRNQVTEEILQNYDKVIVMAEKDTIQNWLSTSDKFIYWKVEDPRFKGLEAARETRNLIKDKILNHFKNQ